jgi:Fe-S cluster assembly iron-binding protein IscA
MISVTDLAKEKIEEILKQEPEGTAIRVAVSPG